MIGLLPVPFPALVVVLLWFSGSELLSGETSGFKACNDGFRFCRERGVMVSSREPVWACIAAAGDVSRSQWSIRWAYKE
jgi:hypothetical protein